MNGRDERRRRWYPLDNQARIFPPIRSLRFPTVFRVSARTAAAVNVVALERALAATWRRHPHFRVDVRRGIFWHFLQECAPGTVQSDEQPPCSIPPKLNQGTPLITVRARGRRIAVEASHILTDGTGALRFLKTLLTAYRAELGSAAAPSAVVHPAVDLGEPDASEGEYAGRRYYEPRLPRPVESRPAWHLPGPRLPAGTNHVTTVRYSVASLREVARTMQVSVTDLLVAAFVYALQNTYLARREPRRRRRPIRVLIPVNMRPYTGSATMRNFFVYVLVELDQRLGRYELPEIARKVHHQLRAELDGKNLRRQITRNVQPERNALVKILPVFVKDWILRVVFRARGEAVNTASFSNLGRVELDDHTAEIVESFDFLPPPSPITGVNMTLISHADTATVGFGSVRREHEVERRVVRTLHGLGLWGTLRTNWGGE